MDQVRERFQNLHEIVMLRGPSSTATSGTTWSAAPRPRPRCGATGWRSTPSPSGRASCATSVGSTAAADSSAAPSRCRWRWRRSAASSGSRRRLRGCCGRRGRVRLRHVSELGVGSGARGDRKAHARRASRCSSSTCAATTPGWNVLRPRGRGRVSRALPHGRYRALQPPRARHRQALPRRLGARARRRHVPAGARLEAGGQAAGPVPAAADHQGHRHRRGCRVWPSSTASTSSTCRTTAAASSITALGAIDVLPEIVAATAGRAEIIVDGSFCRGTDVLKALALGANAVASGGCTATAWPPPGRDGIVRVLELLHDEMERLGLLGRQPARASSSLLCARSAADPAAPRAQCVPVHRRSRRPLLMAAMLETQRVRQEIREGRITGTSRGLAHGSCNAIWRSCRSSMHSTSCSLPAQPALVSGARIIDPGSPEPKKLRRAPTCAPTARATRSTATACAPKTAPTSANYGATTW